MSIVSGGDWKQLLPVVAGERCDAAKNVCLMQSELWSHFEVLFFVRSQLYQNLFSKNLELSQVLTLKTNMRATDAKFADVIEETGRGEFQGIFDISVRTATANIPIKHGPFYRL